MRSKTQITKRVITLLMAFLMMLSCMSLGIQAQDPEQETSGTCGENLTWAYDEQSRTLTISGTGPMENYGQISLAPWIDYRDIIETLVIEEGVTTIGDRAFESCVRLTDVVMPKSLTAIGENAFDSCEQLENVVIPEGVTEILYGAFTACISLKRIALPDSLIMLYGHSFADCKSLQKVNIPKNVILVGNYSFLGCSSLESINVSEDNTRYCSLNGVLYNKTKTALCVYPAGKKVKSYTVPDGVTVLGNCAFQSCNSVTNLTLPDSIAVIESGALSFSNSCCTDILYTGTEEQWNAIDIKEDNQYLLDRVTIHYEVDPTALFVDTPKEAWYYEAVEYMVQEKLMYGISDIDFGVDTVCTRAMLVTVLYRLEGRPDVTGLENSFTDVVNTPATAYYYDAVLWAQDKEIVYGADETAFIPNGELTREQLAACLYRYAKNVKQYDVSTDEQYEQDAVFSSFADWYKIEDYAKESLKFALYTGFISGSKEADGLYMNPKQGTTRVEFASMLKRFMQIDHSSVQKV
ncbi:MAG: leucine-rich repeat protein [Clostridiales bacterium]|nr:leucine-rich repeat protein [Clostridiales bacterium]